MKEKKFNTLEEAVAYQEEISEIAKMLRKPILYILAERYHNYLGVLRDLKEKDELAFYGERRGLSGYLSNLFGDLQKKFGFKDCLAPKSLKFLTEESEGKIPIRIGEHVVPKQKYIQDVAEEAAFSGNPMSVDDLYKLLEERWWICRVTKEEDNKMNGKLVTSMGDDWDGKDWWWRYRKTKIEIPGWFKP